jgi:uncharacterized SAM-binding protein YcdF (DUF218 family)
MTYTQPLILLLAAAVIAGVATLPRSKGRRVALASLFGLFLLSWPPVDLLLGLPLEWSSYPVRPFNPPPGIQAIVVLGSSAQPPRYERPYTSPDIDTFRRSEHAAWIYRSFGPLPVLACEGPHWQKQSLMRELLRRAGVADNMIWVENRSRSTHENAVFGAAILREHAIERVALVVEAQSMLRAAASFRKQGITVVEAPSEFRTLGRWNKELIPSWHAIRRNENTLHEALGLAWYRLRGWI